MSLSVSHALGMQELLDIIKTAPTLFLVLFTLICCNNISCTQLFQENHLFIFHALVALKAAGIAHRQPVVPE